MNRKRRKCNKFEGFKILKNLPTIFIFVLSIPLNYHGEPLKLKDHSCGPKIPNGKCFISALTSNTKVDNPVTSNQTDHEESDTAIITDNIFTLSVLILIISTVLTSFILGYLRSVSLVKQSLVLFLYRDSAKLLLLLIGSVTLAIFFSYFKGNGITMPPTYAKIISYCCINLMIHLLLVLNSLEILQLYCMKEMIVDSPMPWADDDHDAIKKMRLFSLLLVTSVTSLLFVFKTYPKLYYSLIGDNTPIHKLSTGTFAFTVILGLLVLTYIISTLVTIFYAWRKNHDVNTQVPSKLRYIQLFFIFVIAFILSSGMYFNIWAGGNFWILFLILQMMVGVLSPITIILTSSKLRGYVHGHFKDTALFIRNFCGQYCSRRSRQVSPLEEFEMN